MICEKCNSKLHYGDKFCNVCGEKIDTTGYEKEYNKTNITKKSKIVKS